MGGTQGGRARLSVTLLCLWAVWPEQKVNLFRSSCLRKKIIEEKNKTSKYHTFTRVVKLWWGCRQICQTFYKPKVFPYVDFSFRCLYFNLKFGNLLKWEALASQTRNWLIQIKALNTFVKILSRFKFPLNLNLWLTLASTFLTLPQSSWA